MSLVRGGNGILLTYDGGVWKHYACLRTITLSVNTEFIEATVSGHGKNAVYAPTKNNFTGSAEGVVDLNPSGKLSLADLRAKQLAHQVMLCRFQRTDDSGNVYTDQVYFYISNSTDTGNFDNVQTFSLELRGTGAITQIFTPTASLNSNPVQTYYYPPTGGESSFTNPSIIGKNIIGVFKDGIQFNVITTGTPVGKEVLYVSATGYFEYSQTFDAAEQDSLIQYQDT